MHVIKPSVKLDYLAGTQTLYAEGKSVTVPIEKIAFLEINSMTAYISIPCGKGVPDGFCWVPMEVIKV